MSALSVLKAQVKSAFDAQNAEVARRSEEIAGHQQQIADHQAEIRRLQDEINAALPDLYRLQGRYSALEETEALASPQQPHRTPRRPRRGRR